VATPPKTWVEWADFFSKTVIALAGLAFSGATLILTQAEKSRARAEQHQADAGRRLADKQTADLALRNEGRQQAASDRERKNDWLKMLPDDLQGEAKIGIALENCNDPAAIELRTGINAETCQRLARLGDQRLAATASPATASARTAVLQRDPKAFLNSATAAAQNAGVAAAEAARPAASGRWFAVVGTLPRSAPGAVHDLAAQLNARLLGAGLPDGDVHVYRTRISNSFALTSGADKTEAEARARAKMLRRAGFSDAFAQPDREWSKADDLR
jgi:hypothetical protein